jgi:hypothetical protein
MSRSSKRKCLCCKEFFIPDYRNAERQNYCQKSACRKASKTASQKLWSSKNPDYFKDSHHVERVREWRRVNPGRSRRKDSGDLLQDRCSQIPLEKQKVVEPLSSRRKPGAIVLQDFCLAQHPVFVGLISHLTGVVLQDDIASIARRLEQLGHDVIASNPTNGGHYDPQDPDLSRPHPHHSGAVQLGGSPSGP